MKYINEQNKFIEEYKRYKINILEPTLVDIKKFFNNWKNPEHWRKYTTGKGVATPSPIRMILTRIKEPEKVVNKIFLKPDLFPNGFTTQSFHSMHDTIGVRIIVYFTSQLPLIDRELHDSNLFEISEENRPKAYLGIDFLNRLGLGHIEQKDKESGYQSIHYSVRFKKSSVPDGKQPYFEIQVRTLAQELWSELEHVLSYKPENRTHFSAKRRFEILSREVSVIDEHFNLLYEELIHNQEVATYLDSDVLTFENIPKVMLEIGVQCALTDLYPILKLLSSRGIKTIGDLLKIATPRRLITIRNTYISTRGHAPDNLELISVIASLKGAQTKEIEIKRIKSQIHYYQSKTIFGE